MSNQPSLIRLPEVERRVGLRRSQIRKMEALGRFPRKVRITRGAVAWVESEVSDFIVKRMQERGQ